ncbi:MAG: hypothetical protein CM15mP89_2900 [Gammaproteobacteria bacterium]|nr:MAG: hypothetical protein CM15mP89_2900 [Gammaproteobacteria bacterium]
MHSVRGGGGFGRRLSNEYVYEAALIAQRGFAGEAAMVPEDDMAFDYFRSALYLDMEGGVSNDGHLSAWKLHVIAGSADGESANYGGTYRTRDFPEARVPHYDIATTLLPSKTPTGAWRAPFSNVYAFAEQSFLCELATASGQDYRDFLLDLLGEDEWFKDGDRNSLNTARAKGCHQCCLRQCRMGSGYARRSRSRARIFLQPCGHVAEVAEVSVDADKETHGSRCLGGRGCGSGYQPQWC